MNIWGISAGGHDASVSIVRNNRIVFASQSERFSRIKNDKELSVDLLNCAYSFGNPDVCMWYEKPHKRFLRNIIWDKKINFFNAKKYLENLGILTEIKYCNHHDSHAAACLYTYSGNAENSLIFIIDAVGELNCMSTYIVKNNKLKILDVINYPNSLGLFYSAMTDLLGYKANEEEYIVMGMASYGDPYRFYNRVNDRIFKNGFKHLYYLNRGCRGLFEDNTITRYKFDIAAATQKIYEDKLLSYVKKQLYKYNSKKIMLGGGCALNCTANSKLINLVDDIYIFPHPGDGGASVGAALLYKKKTIQFNNAFLGFQEPDQSIESVVDKIIKDGFCFVVNGKAEFGPRALGNRSILADPRDKNMQDRINNIKGRELFRPFAPSILLEYFDQYFYSMGIGASPYMQYTFKCKKPTAIPATVHIDGTSRVQTVDSNNPFLYEVLKLWFKKTNCPVLLNTSLNIKGKPLVNSLKDLSEFCLIDNNI